MMITCVCLFSGHGVGVWITKIRRSDFCLSVGYFSVELAHGLQKSEDPTFVLMWANIYILEE